MNKKEIRYLIKYILKFKGNFNYKYVPIKVIDSFESFIEFNKNGLEIITISNNSYIDTIDNISIDITNKNLNEIIDKLYDIKNNDISEYMIKALDSLNLKEEKVNYFTENIEHFNELKNKILKLKSINDEKIK